MTPSWCRKVIAATLKVVVQRKLHRKVTSPMVLSTQVTGGAKFRRRLPQSPSLNLLWIVAIWYITDINAIDVGLDAEFSKLREQSRYIARNKHTGVTEMQGASPGRGAALGTHTAEYSLRH